MIPKTIERHIASPDDEAATDALFEDETKLFWVDWRDEDDAIVDYCESVLSTGSLASEWDGLKLFIRYKDTRHEVPLTHSGVDRHITMVALNEVLAGEHEIRFLWASDGGDTLAFVLLGADEWADLEQRHGVEAVTATFLTLGEFPNVFTDPLDRHRPGYRPRPWWKFWG